MKQKIIRIVCGIVSVVLGCGSLVTPAAASELDARTVVDGSDNQSIEVVKDKAPSAMKIVNVANQATETKPKSTTLQTENTGKSELMKSEESLTSDKVVAYKSTEAPEKTTNAKVEAKNNQQSATQVIDLRIIKVQIKQGKLKNNQFVVLKNYGASVDIKDFKLQLLKIGKGASPAVIREVALGELQFNKTNRQLATSEVLIVVNDLELAKNFINLQTNLVQCFSDCRPTRAWLELSGATKYQLKLIHQPTQQLVNQFNYQKKTTTKEQDYHQFDNYDFLSIVTINGRESDIWQGFSALRADPIWLKAEQLPPFTTREPNCKAGEDLIQGQCFKKCPKNYTRDLITNICERDSCPAGKLLDVATDTCVVNPASCKDGYEYNPVTKRCNKIKVVEPKTCPAGSVFNPQTKRCVKTTPPLEPKACPAGYYLNPTTNRCNKNPLPIEPKTCPAGYFLNLATNRCNKIVLAVAKPPCPEGQLRHPETGRCRKIVLEVECKDTQELVNGKCLKRCASDQVRSSDTGRCQKAEQTCQDGFDKDPLTGICVKSLVAKDAGNQRPTDTADKNYDFDWLKLLNSPLSGALAASAVFVIYDKFFRAKS